MGENMFDDLIRAGLRADVAESFPSGPFDSPAPKSAKTTTSPASDARTMAVALPPAEPMASKTESVEETRAKVQQRLLDLKTKGSPAAKDTNLIEMQTRAP
jgi:hypothetical protein